MHAYGNRQNAIMFARANNSDLLRALKQLTQTWLKETFFQNAILSNVFTAYHYYLHVENKTAYRLMHFLSYYRVISGNYSRNISDLTNGMVHTRAFCFFFHYLNLLSLGLHIQRFRQVICKMDVYRVANIVSKKSGNYAMCLTYSLAQVMGLRKHRRCQRRKGSLPVFVWAYRNPFAK